MVDRLAGGARALQHLDNVVVVTLARDIQRRLTTIHRLVLVGTRLDQQSHDLEVTEMTSDKQRRQQQAIGPFLYATTRRASRAMNSSMST